MCVFAECVVQLVICLVFLNGHATIQVDYREPVAAVGRMPGGRSKSEGPPNEREHDTAILIEQAVTPLFPVGFTDNVQVRLTCRLSRAMY